MAHKRIRLTLRRVKEDRYKRLVFLGNGYLLAERDKRTQVLIELGEATLRFIEVEEALRAQARIQHEERALTQGELT